MSSCPSRQNVDFDHLDFFFFLFSDVSTTKMALKLDMQFESYLLNETSPKYLEFKEKVIDAVSVFSLALK